VFTTGLDPFQALIGAVGNSLAAHVALGFDGQLLHAYEPGIVLEPRTTYFDTCGQHLVAEYAILPDVDDGFVEALTHVGKRGFLLGATQIAIVRALRLCGSPLQHFIPTNERTCARFAMTVDRTGDRIPEWRNLDRRAVVPGDLLAIADVGPSFQRLA
jgi:hypothetical protein